MHPDGGQGLCLPVAAAVSWALCELFGFDPGTVSASSGTFDGQDHWWVTVTFEDGESFIVDPTRHQFRPEDQALIYDQRTAYEYAASETFPPGWSREHVVAEAARAFLFPAAGIAWSEYLLAELDDLAESVRN